MAFGDRKRCVRKSYFKVFALVFSATAFVTDMELTGVESQIVTTLHPLEPKKPEQIM